MEAAGCAGFAGREFPPFARGCTRAETDRGAKPTFPHPQVYGIRAQPETSVPIQAASNRQPTRED